MTSSKSIHWFRQDLRLSDNPAFYEACARGKVLPIFILDNASCGSYSLGSASRWWLSESLISLNRELKGNLKFYVGDTRKIIFTLIKKNNIDSVFYNRCYEPHATNLEHELNAILQEKNIEIQSRNGSLLFEPWEATKDDGDPYRVFTPFFKKCLTNLSKIAEPLPKPNNIQFLGDASKIAINLDEVEEFSQAKWHKKIDSIWEVSEIGAHNRLKNFLKSALPNYKIGRDYPSSKSVSRLSPYLHYGQVSPQQVYWEAMQKSKSENRDHFIRELFWREFSYSLLFHFPALPNKNLQQKFDAFPWLKNKNILKTWQHGLTGYPIVDAGMRELWQTGYMHNRIRMIVASFLVKNLLIHWHEGERWFWDCLVDADLASNCASWQWVAGCGADAAPYFRVFNPITQGEKFDKDGVYTRKFVPELKLMPNKYLFKPFDAPLDVLEKSGVILGKTYPKPIVELKWSRERALDAYYSIKT